MFDWPRVFACIQGFWLYFTILKLVFHLFPNSGYILFLKIRVFHLFLVKLINCEIVNLKVSIIEIQNFIIICECRGVQIQINTNKNHKSIFKKKS